MNRKDEDTMNRKDEDTMNRTEQITREQRLSKIRYALLAFLHKPEAARALFIIEDDGSFTFVIPDGSVQDAFTLAGTTIEIPVFISSSNRELVRDNLDRFNDDLGYFPTLCSTVKDLRDAVKAVECWEVVPEASEEDVEFVIEMIDAALSTLPRYRLRDVFEVSEKARQAYGLIEG